jgi:hypothetical protein
MVWRGRLGAAQPAATAEGRHGEDQRRHHRHRLVRRHPGEDLRRQARKVMEVYVAADLSAERHKPVSLPLNATPMTTRSGAPA